MQSNGRFCAGAPSAPDPVPAQAIPEPVEVVNDSQDVPELAPARAEPVGIVRDSQVPPTLLPAPSAESLAPTVPATPSEIGAMNPSSVEPPAAPAPVEPKPVEATQPPTQLEVVPVETPKPVGPTPLESTVASTPPGFRTGLNSPSLSTLPGGFEFENPPAGEIPTPSQTGREPGQSSGDRPAHRPEDVPPVPESEADAEDSISQVLEPKGRDPMYWRLSYQVICVLLVLTHIRMICLVPSHQVIPILSTKRWKGEVHTWSPEALENKFGSSHDCTYLYIASIHIPW